MPRVVDVTLPLVRLVLTRKRWGASADYVCVRFCLLPGWHCYFAYSDRLTCTVCDHHYRVARYNTLRNLHVAARKIGLDHLLPAEPHKTKPKTHPSDHRYADWIRS
jgi:hypothetical protein